MPKRMSPEETAAAVREALKQAFPKTKFRVYSKSSSTKPSLSVHWIDGPTTEQVDPIIDSFPTVKKIMKIKLDLIAEIDANNIMEARRILDGFRESVLPTQNYGISLYENYQIDRDEKEA